MDPSTGVTAVLGRIDAIANRFGGSGTDGSFTVTESAEFDPFGATYQAAVAGLQTAPNGAGLARSYGSGMVSGAALGGGTQRALPSVASVASIQAAIAGAAGPAGNRGIGGYGTLVPPASLTAYGNGRLPDEALVAVGQSGHRLYAPAAASFQSMVSAAKAEGIDIRITDSYRTYDQQLDLADRKGLYSNGGLAAEPGTSPHGWGMAIDADVRDARTLDWIRTNGPRFGWVETTPREPWHWEFRPNQV